MRFRLICLLFVMAFCFNGIEISQAYLLVREAGFYPGFYGYGGDRWSNTTNALDLATGNRVVKKVSFDNTVRVNAADALWIDVGDIYDTPGNTLSPAEVINVTNFINSGRRVVMFGENDSWVNWNNSILSLVGGSPEDSYSYGSASTQVSNSLTDGVSSIYIGGGGNEAGLAAGGTQLFSQNVATLWSPNVLSILDLGVFEDQHLDDLDNTQFRDNVVNWITTPVPEPTSLLLTCSILGIVSASYRRRRA